MFDSFDARLRALLEDDGLDDAHGGGIAKHGDRFSYRLYDQPEPADGEQGLYSIVYTPHRHRSVSGQR